MKAVVFSGGEIRNYSAIKKHMEGAKLVICADSGVRHAFSLGIVPDLIVGDMDSVSKQDLDLINSKGIKILTYPIEKDYTDTQLALETARQKGATKVMVLAALGERPDHSLANILLMVHFKRFGMDVRIAGEDWEMFLLEKDADITGSKGDILSLIPITPQVTGIETEGLYYPLKGETLKIGPARGVSNLFVKDNASIKLKDGLLIAVKVTFKQ
ncbi:MAG: thiamine diphosphokinase [Thermoanaerobacterales bacterium]|jgi:thiamine pyrophosphokinase|nr:thiamine diphosphokinase [Thermoanaerobacterales bacterium]